GSRNLDLRNFSFLGFKELTSTGTILPAQYYALRFTFRDSETHKNYVHYKITSMLIDDPSEQDEPNLWGSSGRTGIGDFLRDIPKVIKEDQRERYRNSGEEEYRVTHRKFPTRF